MNVIEAIRDVNLFRPFIGDDLASWQPWMTALRVLYGFPVFGIEQRALVQECTGRDPELLPDEGFDAALFLTGRRSGKSRMAAIIGAFEAALAGHEKKLSKGETGIVAICAPTKWQAGIVTRYVRAAFRSPLLEAEIVGDTRDGFTLSNGIEIAILAGDWRTVRGPTLVAAVCDEAAFFGVDEESKIRSDTELIRAIRPGLATTRGKLVVSSSPYAKKGWCYAQHRKNYGNDKGTTLVWNCASRVMNPTLSQAVVDAALAEDRQAALAEYLGQFRDDVCEFLPRSVIESVVVKGRIELMPRRDNRYSAFVDVSGGRSDDAALAIGHREGRKVVVDFAKRYRPPFNPYEVIEEMAEELRRYHVRRVTGDNYSAEFVAQAFEAQGVQYVKADKAKSALYAEVLPRICSGEIELLDDETLISQLANLERRTRSGGRDIIDHSQGNRDDLANAVAGVSATVSAKQIILGRSSQEPKSTNQRKE